MFSVCFLICEVTHTSNGHMLKAFASVTLNSRHASSMLVLHQNYLPCLKIGYLFVPCLSVTIIHSICLYTNDKKTQTMHKNKHHRTLATFSLCRLIIFHGVFCSVSTSTLSSASSASLLTRHILHDSLTDRIRRGESGSSCARYKFVNVCGYTCAVERQRHQHFGWYSQQQDTAFHTG